MPNRAPTIIFCQGSAVPDMTHRASPVPFFSTCVRAPTARGIAVVALRPVIHAIPTSRPVPSSSSVPVTLQCPHGRTGLVPSPALLLPRAPAPASHCHLRVGHEPVLAPASHRAMAGSPCRSRASHAPAPTSSSSPSASGTPTPALLLALSAAEPNWPCRAHVLPSTTRHCLCQTGPTCCADGWTQVRSKLSCHINSIYKQYESYHI